MKTVGEEIKENNLKLFSGIYEILLATVLASPLILNDVIYHFMDVEKNKIVFMILLSVIGIMMLAVGFDFVEKDKNRSLIFTIIGNVFVISSAITFLTMYVFENNSNIYVFLGAVILTLYILGLKRHYDTYMTIKEHGMSRYIVMKEVETKQNEAVIITDPRTNIMFDKAEGILRMDDMIIVMLSVSDKKKDHRIIKENILKAMEEGKKVEVVKDNGEFLKIVNEEEKKDSIKCNVVYNAP